MKSKKYGNDCFTNIGLSDFSVMFGLNKPEEKTELGSDSGCWQ